MSFSHNGIYPLTHAVRNKNIEIVKMLLSHPKIDVNVQTDGMTPLRIALDMNNKEMVDIFLSSYH